MQSYWANNAGYVSWVEPSGAISQKRAANRKIGFKAHGHTIFRGGVWESNFESEFDIDNEIHATIAALNALKPYGRTPSEFLASMKLLIKRDRALRDICKFYKLEEDLHRSLLLLIHSLLIKKPRKSLPIRKLSSDTRPAAR